MNLVLNPIYSGLKPMLESLPSIFENTGRTVYKARNELRVVEAPSLTLNVKSYHKPILINRIIYTFFRKSKARRAYEYAQVLQAKGFGTPEPIAYLEYKTNGLLDASFFVSEHISDFRMMREFADGSEISGREDIIQAFGAFAARLHEAGILHLDLSIGNILFKKDDQGIHFWLVDLNRMRFCKIDQRLGCKNFERLRGNSEFFQLLANTYAGERGFDKAKCLSDILRFQQKSVASFRSKSMRKQRLATLKRTKR